MRVLVLLVTAAGCRYGFDAVGDAVGDADPDTLIAPDHLTIQIVGDGAIVVAGTACDHTCTVPRAGAVALTYVADETWRLASVSDASCASAQCTVGSDVAEVTATFELAPITANIAFVSSVNAPLTSGLPAIDAFCQTQANLAGLPPSTYVAMLATTGNTLASRLSGSRGWVRVDGFPVIDQPSDLGTARARAILLDENGVPSRADVITGSGGSGTPIGTRCNEWTMNTGASNGGLADRSGSYAFGNFVFPACTARVYCFGTGRNIPVELQPPPFPTGRYLFASTNVYAAVGGIATADARCQSEATAAGLPGVYRAVLATTAQSAAAHIGSLAGRWRRPDGVVVSKEGLVQPLDTAAVVDATGAFVAPSTYWLIGAASLSTASASLTQSCNEWTDSSGFGFYGLYHSLIPITGTSCCAPCSAGALMCAEL